MKFFSRFSSAFAAKNVKVVESQTAHEILKNFNEEKLQNLSPEHVKILIQDLYPPHAANFDLQALKNMLKSLLLGAGENPEIKYKKALEEVQKHAVLNFKTQKEIENYIREKNIQPEALNNIIYKIEQETLEPEEKLQYIRASVEKLKLQITQLENSISQLESDEQKEQDCVREILASKNFLIEILKKTHTDR